MIVAHTDLVSYLLIAGERTVEVRRIWRRDPVWVLPPLWRSQFLNALTLAARTGVLDADQTRACWSQAVRLFGSSELEPGGAEVLDAAVRLGISAYDAHFLVVAERLDCRLVTNDAELLERCPGRAVSIARFGRLL